MVQKSVSLLASSYSTTIFAKLKTFLFIAMMDSQFSKLLMVKDPNESKTTYSPCDKIDSVLFITFRLFFRLPLYLHVSEFCRLKPKFGSYSCLITFTS